LLYAAIFEDYEKIMKTLRGLNSSEK